MKYLLIAILTSITYAYDFSITTTNNHDRQFIDWFITCNKNYYSGGYGSYSLDLTPGDMCKLYLNAPAGELNVDMSRLSQVSIEGLGLSGNEVNIIHTDNAVFYKDHYKIVYDFMVPQANEAITYISQPTEISIDNLAFGYPQHPLGTGALYEVNTLIDPESNPEHNFWELRCQLETLATGSFEPSILVRARPGDYCVLTLYDLNVAFGTGWGSATVVAFGMSFKFDEDNTRSPLTDTTRYYVQDSDTEFLSTRMKSTSYTFYVPLDTSNTQKTYDSVYIGIGILMIVLTLVTICCIRVNE